MKRMIKRLLPLVAVACLVFGIVVPSAIAMPAVQSSTDFNQENLSSGDLVTDQLDGVTISTRNADAIFGAMIFDTIPIYSDSDWAGAGVGNVLIISEDGDWSDPDDIGMEGTIEFTWDEPVDIETIDLLDIEKPGTTVTIFDIDGNSQQFDAEMGPNGNLQTLEIDVDNVEALEVFFSSTGAIANIVTSTSSQP